MRAIFVLFDSLNRLALGSYGGTLATPNFDRFAQRSVTFDTHYVGSLPVCRRGATSTPAG